MFNVENNMNAEHFFNPGNSVLVNEVPSKAKTMFSNPRMARPSIAAGIGSSEPRV
jgi:hypothetical protein